MAVVGAVLLFLKLRKKGGDQEGPGPV
jgi:hypothetical protein